MKPQSPYLTSLAISLEEHSRDVSELTATIAELARFIHEQVEEPIRSQMAGAIASHWLDAADQVLAFVLQEAGEAGEAANLELARVKEEFARNPHLEQSAVEEEILGFSRLLSERLLARWYSALHALDIPATGVGLNASMLPGSTSFEDLLECVDIGSHDVSTSMVSLGVRGYRESLRARAEGNVIACGGDLFMVFNPESQNLPFTCFSSFNDASAAARVLTKSRTGQHDAWSRHVQRRRAEILNAARRAILPSRIRESISIAALGEAVEMLVSDLQRQSAGRTWHEPETAIPGLRRLDKDERLLAHPVVIGVDAISAAFGGPWDLAMCKLEERSAVIRAALFDYADAREITPGAAADIFAVNVAAGVQCQFLEHIEIGKTNRWNPLVAVTLCDRFQSVHGVSHQRTVQLLEDAHAGTAYISCPHGLLMTDLR